MFLNPLMCLPRLLRDNLRPKYTRPLELAFEKDTKPELLFSVYDGGLDEEDVDGMYVAPPAKLA